MPQNNKIAKNISFENLPLTTKLAAWEINVSLSLKLEAVTWKNAIVRFFGLGCRCSSFHQALKYISSKYLADPAPIVIVKVGIENPQTAISLCSIPGPLVLAREGCDWGVVSLPSEEK